MAPLLVVLAVVGFLLLFSKTLAITVPVVLPLCAVFLWVVSKTQKGPRVPR